MMIENRGDMVVERGFTDTCVLTKNIGKQSTTFGGNSTAKVGIEGYPLTARPLLHRGYPIFSNFCFASGWFYTLLIQTTSTGGKA